MTILSRVPSFLNAAFGIADPEYRASAAGTWATLPGAHYGTETETLDPDPERSEEEKSYAVQMTVDQASPRLTYGFQVRIGGASGRVYAVETASINAHHGVMSYTLRRDELIRRTADRGALR